MTEVLGTRESKTRGEAAVAEQLSQLDSDALTLAFNINFLPGVRDIDTLLIHKNIGAFFIEIKSYRVSEILEIGYSSFRTKAYDSTEPPWLQAYSQYEGFRDFLAARLQKWNTPNFAATALFNNITRFQWRQAFGGSEVANNLADRLLFREDITDMESLEARLSYVMLNPPVRNGRNARKVSDDFLGIVRSIFDTTGRSKPTTSERMKLVALEQGITKKLQGDFPARGEKYVVFNGYPGTGKTFRLLSIGLHHAYNNAKVLFVCFNKTLGADVRRLLQFEEKLKHAKGAFEVLDINQLALRCFEQNSMPYMNSPDADEWGKAVVEELGIDKESVIEKYDTILIDEAQDMKEWQLSLVRLHASVTPTICMAVGQGQELYSEQNLSEDWIETLARQKSVNRIRLNRNFRNTDSQFYAALAFYQAWPDKLSVIPNVYSQIFNKNKQSELGFDRTGEPLIYIPVPALKGEFYSIPESQLETVSDYFSELIQNEIFEIKEDGNLSPNGLLILVPDSQSTVHLWVKTALEKACNASDDISYIDYTDDISRRSSAMNNEIRLCTFHSARGLEGERVLIFGLENIAEFARKTSTKAENLAFIVLSRGIFKTTAIVRTLSENVVHTLLKESMKFLTKANSSTQ